MAMENTWNYQQLFRICTWYVRLLECQLQVQIPRVLAWRPLLRAWEVFGPYFHTKCRPSPKRNEWIWEKCSIDIPCSNIEAPPGLLYLFLGVASRSFHQNTKLPGNSSALPDLVAVWPVPLGLPSPSTSDGCRVNAKIQTPKRISLAKSKRVQWVQTENTGHV